MAIRWSKLGSKEIIASGTIVAHSQSVTINVDTSQSPVRVQNDAFAEVEFKFQDDPGRKDAWLKFEADSSKSDKLLMYLYNFNSAIGAATSQPVQIGDFQLPGSGTKYMYLNLFCTRQGNIRHLSYTFFVSDTDSFE